MQQRDEDLHSNYSIPVKVEMSNLMTQSQINPRFSGNYSDLKSAKFSSKEVEESKSIVENFLGKKNPGPKKHKVAGKTQVFNRLHNQAVVKQKRRKEIDEKRAKSLHRKKLQHSKSTYLNENKLYTVDGTPKKARKLCRNQTRRDLDYNASAGHSLYLKSRGKSSKRDRSIHKSMRRKSLKQKREQDKLGKTTLMSERSRRILDKKEFGDILNDNTILSNNLDVQR